MRFTVILAASWLLTACPTGPSEPFFHGCEYLASEASEASGQSEQKACRSAVFALEPTLLGRQAVEVSSLPLGSFAYNAGLVKYQGEFIMAFRLDTPRRDVDPVTAQIGLVTLDANFKQVGPYSLLDTRRPGDLRPTAEDPRIFEYDDALYVVYNTTHEGQSKSRRIHLGRIQQDRLPNGGAYFSLNSNKELMMIQDGQPTRLEKNWSPFVYDNAIHLLYQSNPPWVLKIAREDLESTATTLAPQQVVRGAQRVAWPAGTMRGGTPAVYDASLDRYITVFHSAAHSDLRQEHRGLYYFMGICTFYPEAPFAIDRLISKPLVAQDFYHDADSDKQIVFPQGLVLEGDRLHVSYGKDDRSMHVMTLDRQQLLDEMQQPTYE